MINMTLPPARTMVPAPIFRRLMAVRRRAVYAAFRDAGVVYIHVPRSAGTSISSACYPIWINHFTLREHLADFSPRLLGLPRFSVVRNPWDRLVSAWSFVRAGGGNTDAGHQRIVLLRPELYASPLFEHFDHFVEEWLAGQDLQKIDEVFRPQADYLTDAKGAVALDHVGRLEHLPKTEAWLAGIMVRPPQFKQLNRSERSDYRHYYTPKTRDIVARLYARDIALFNYDF